MFYKLLGIVVWKVAKSLLRYRYGAVMAPKSLLAGGVLLALGGVALAVRQRSNGGE
jgi:hypothetical protein